ncbi:hypothetical protein HPC49_30965 [Pyxidicoccus fallax]|uniref:Lipoprotein n=1 Tax=Pyxidicoccus fallax TaxID=394095 RepID=A0A848LJF8_9BACT|nr:hypothetical protein [Pyxidicoccus fallax]NMO17885.1 hypothetical protein [Pyxidicoccus fallax]NPC82632.1 hypothetical protein [Pyxidicoccus fallax]
MHRFLCLSAALFVLPLFACGRNDGAVAESCKDDVVCEAGLACYQNYPGTFCAQSCSEEGDTANCPQGTVCTAQLGEERLCSLTCEDTDDCREGYVCVAVADGQAKACRVKSL